jgi:hypothetical protein
VAEFLGPDRAEKRLAVLPIDPSSLVKEEGGAGPDVPAGAMLSDALSAMLLAETDRVRVVDDKAGYLGTLTVSALVKSADNPMK